MTQTSSLKAIGREKWGLLSKLLYGWKGKALLNEWPPNLDTSLHISSIFFWAMSPVNAELHSPWGNTKHCIFQKKSPFTSCFRNFPVVCNFQCGIWLKCTLLPRKGFLVKPVIWNCIEEMYTYNPLSWEVYKPKMNDLCAPLRTQKLTYKSCIENCAVKLSPFLLSCLEGPSLLWVYQLALQFI